MAIQNGENPRVIKEKRSAFLPNSQQMRESAETGDKAREKG